MAVVREYRAGDTPLEAERRARGECLVCGKPREEFDGRHKGHKAGIPSAATLKMCELFDQNPADPDEWVGGHFCCSSACTAIYWEERHPNQQQARRTQYERQKGICAMCHEKVRDTWDHPYVLDHIVPIAAGGSQWDPANHQVLCDACNKVKTAKDMTVIAHYRKYHKRDLLEDATTRQVLLPGVP